MTMISKYPLEVKIKDRVYEVFLQALSGLKSPNEFNLFLNEFLSPTEKLMLAKRLSIAVLLAKDYDTRSICKILKVSFNTIRGVNLWIKHKKGSLNEVVNKIIRDEKNDKLWANIDYLLERVLLPSKGSNWSEKRKKLEITKSAQEKPF